MPLDCCEGVKTQLTAGKGPLITVELWCIVGLCLAIYVAVAQIDDFDIFLHCIIIIERDFTLALHFVIERNFTFALHIYDQNSVVHKPSF